MAIIGVLWPLASLVALVGFIWLCVVAFKRHVVWGLLVLFLSPITAIVFAVKFWSESKKPFLVYMSSVFVCIGFLFYMVSVVGLGMMAMADEMSGELAQTQAEHAAQAGGGPAPTSDSPGVLDPEEEAELRKVRETYREMQQRQQAEGAGAAGRGSDAGIARVGMGRGDEIAAPEAAAGTDVVPPGFHSVPVPRAGEYVGKDIRVVRKNGQEIRGTLAQASPHGLLVERQLSSGSIWFEVSNGEVETLLVAYR